MPQCSSVFVSRTVSCEVLTKTKIRTVNRVFETEIDGQDDCKLRWSIFDQLNDIRSPIVERPENVEGQNRTAVLRTDCSLEVSA